MTFVELNQEPEIGLECRKAAITGGQVQLYSFNLDEEAGLLPDMMELLSGDEVARARSFKLPKHGQRFAAARAFLRTVLGGIAGESPDALRFEYGPRGKPALSPENGLPDLRFNLSHSGDRALLAVALGLDLGVDVEMRREGLALSHMSEIAFNQREREWLDGHEPAAREQAFFRMWTLKEAVLKVRGEGLAEGLKKYWVLPGSLGQAQVRDYGAGTPLQGWVATSFALGNDFQAAVAWHDEKRCKNYSLVDIVPIKWG